ncbi:MAG: hypothetical protein M1835_006520 [Candelina submexicana]|nr:MAG: hypothetical protein M1835_006520 [Candelina submexicana]
MPIENGPQASQARLPSFMSVFGEEKVFVEEDAAATQGITQSEGITNTSAKPTSADSHLQPQHQHRGSTSTTNSESTDSSPTSTISTVDSSTMTDPSPRSSPESPVSFPSKELIMQTSDNLDMVISPGHMSDQSRANSPAKKARNTKGLSLNMGASRKQLQGPPRLALMTGNPDVAQDSSSPSSPSFILPPKPPKRRPSKLGLTISTPAVGSLPEKSALRVAPPTPSSSMPNILRPDQSSSLSVFSPTTEPEGGMQLPPFGRHPSKGRFVRPRQHPEYSLFPSAQSSLTNTQRLDELEEDDYAPLSQEAKSPAYPQGPICIYDPYVYLYLEPTNEEAMTFDVILNVAREVLNPFTRVAEDKEQIAVPQVTSDVQKLELDDNVTTILEVTSPATTDSPPSKAKQLQATASPTTPKATQDEPEYMHIPWDHNTNIVDDMLRLVEVIDERVRQKKRVLVHCQCGVSRSASLIVAYGLYKNPWLSVNEAYDAVKKRSKWIGPNMNLIYQLSEFKEKLHARNPSPEHWGGRRSFGVSRSNTINEEGLKTLSPYVHPSPKSPNSEPHSAPLPVQQDDSPLRPDLLSPMSLVPPIDRRQTGEATSGPSSAPSSYPWTSITQPVVNQEALQTFLNSYSHYVPPPLPPDTAFAAADGKPVALEELGLFHEAGILPQNHDRDNQPIHEALLTPFTFSPQAAEFRPGTTYQAANRDSPA